MADRSTSGAEGADGSDEGIESPRRYWIGVVIVVLAILLVIGFALVTFLASEDTGSSVESSGPATPLLA